MIFIYIGLLIALTVAGFVIAVRDSYMFSFLGGILGIILVVAQIFIYVGSFVNYLKIEKAPATRAALVAQLECANTILSITSQVGLAAKIVDYNNFVVTSKIFAKMPVIGAFYPASTLILHAIK